MPAYLLVVDRLEADEDRRFDWVYHNRGDRVLCEAAKDAPGDDAFPGWDYIDNTTAGETNSPVQVRFVDSDVTTHLTIAAQDGTGVLIGDGVGATVLERVPMAMVTRRGRIASFVAVLEPVRAGHEPLVESVSLEQDEDGQTVSVHRDRRIERIRVLATGEVGIVD